VDPFPEAEVSFGLPDDRPPADREEHTDSERPAAGPADPAPAVSWFGGEPDQRP
jgi:hypothetical protein